MKKSSTVWGIAFGRVKLFAFSGALLAAACSDGPTQLEETVVRGPATLEVGVGAAQTGTIGTAVPVAPGVLVRDAQGLPLAGVAVRFAVTVGGGTVDVTSATSDASGIARVGSWVLGPAPGSNILEASTDRLTVAITAFGESPYNITVRWIATPTTRQKEAVERAVARWRSIILSELSDVTFNVPTGACFENQPAIRETVDDLLLYVDFSAIDGVNGVLGEAGPCYIRSDNSLPIFGTLTLDAADLARAEAMGTLDAIVLHEIGHVLGFGTIWREKGVLTGAGGNDPRFTGTNAITAYKRIDASRLSVPVENQGAEGTRDGHWRDSVFDQELMTGYISGAVNPLSAITIGSLTDLGYVTHSGAADVYPVIGGVTGLYPAPAFVDLAGRETVLYPRFRVDP